MFDRDEIPPALIEALLALNGGEDAPEGAMAITRPDPRERLGACIPGRIGRGASLL